MMQDIFIPSKIGSYYVFSKRILSFEITTYSVQACLVYFSKNNIALQNSITIILQDQNPITLINAIKKIAATIGKYDQIVTSLTSSAVIFKELVLPFLGREKIAMIVGYEVEPLLPFSLDEAVIDFLVTQEDKEKKQTTILVAAVRKTDLHAQLEIFEKAGLQVSDLTLDLFALYDFYRHTMYISQAQTSTILVDFSMDDIRLLYIQKGILQSVRLVPFGLKSLINKIDEEMQDVSQISFEEILQEQIQRQHEENENKITEKIIIEFCKQISLSLSFFEKQVKNFVQPSKIICLGIGTRLSNFSDKVFQLSQIPTEILDLKRVIYRNKIQVSKKIKIDVHYSASFILALSAVHYGQVNFLSFNQKKSENYLLNMQLLILFLLSIFACLGIYTASYYQLKQWNSKYNLFKKEMTNYLKEQMDIDVKSIKRMNEVVAAAQNKLQQEKKVCVSFSDPKNSYLHYLEDLCTKIDRKSLGLDLKKLSMQDAMITLQGKVKNFEALQVFEEELIELEHFIIQERPQELNFVVTLKAKEKHQQQ
ncbi:MAG: pilus assembly protein PilM [Candidatus Chromulinivorax sp.]